LKAVATPAPAPAAIRVSRSRRGAEPLGHGSADRAAHLHGRPLAAKGQARADGDSATKQLDGEHAAPVQFAQAMAALEGPEPSLTVPLAAYHALSALRDGSDI
jgi:hypothetical protein